MSPLVFKLFSLLYGFTGSGKSWTGASGPAPRVYLDVEGKASYVPMGRRIRWDPASPPPVADGTWDTAVVRVKRWDQIGQVFTWLTSRKHPFLSWTLDSMQEAQSLLKAETVHSEQRNPSIEEWGVILRKCETFTRAMRDMLHEDDQPLQMATILCGAEDVGKGGDSRKVPRLDGAFQRSVSDPFDLVGYMRPEQVGTLAVPTMRIAPMEGFECRDGTNLLVTKYGPSISKPNLTEMFAVLNPEVASA